MITARRFFLPLIALLVFSAGAQENQRSGKGVITGRVTDSDGNPVVEEPLHLYKLNAAGRMVPAFIGQDPDMYHTDDRGIYRIHGAPMGRYLMSAGYVASDGVYRHPTPRFYYPQTYHPSSIDQERARILDLTDAAELNDVDIVLAPQQRSFDIRGRAISAETGKPIAGLEVGYGPFSLVGKYINSQGESAEKTDVDGRFALLQAAPGKYAVYVGKTGDHDVYSEPTMCEVVDRDLAGVEVRVLKAGSIRGVVALEGVDRSVLNNLRLKYESMTTGQWSLPQWPVDKFDPDGGFHIRGIPPGLVRITASLFAPSDGLMVKSILWNGAPADSFEIAAGAQITGVRIIFTRRNLSLRGNLTFVGGKAPAGVRWWVQADPVGSLPQELRLIAEVDASGNFTLERLSPGEYMLLALPSKVEDLVLVKAAMAFKHRVVVTGNDPPVTLVFDLNQSRKD